MTDPGGPFPGPDPLLGGPSPDAGERTLSTPADPGCSGGETRTPNQRINSPLLCRLSYPGKAARRISQAPGLPPCGTIPVMRLKIGFLLGFVVGFVLGARAGRGAYERIVDCAQTALSSPRCRRFATAAQQAATPLRRAAAGVMVATADAIRDQARHSRGDGS